MEKPVFLASLISVVLYRVTLALSGDIGRTPLGLTGKENFSIHAVNAVKPEFVAEPKDKFFLPNSPAEFLCEAKFVSKLHFNCTGGLVPREVYNNQTGNHVTLLIVKILPVLIKTVASDVVCICVASGYNGQVITSRGATAKKAYLDKNFIISPSVNTIAQKNSLVILSCRPPTGVPIPAVSWWKDGHHIDTYKNRGVVVKTHAYFSHIVIRNVKLSHAGNYSCVAKNLAGRRESDIIKITVKVRPSMATTWDPRSIVRPSMATTWDPRSIVRKTIANTMDLQSTWESPKLDMHTTVLRIVPGILGVVMVTCFTILVIRYINFHKRQRVLKTKRCEGSTKGTALDYEMHVVNRSASYTEAAPIDYKLNTSSPICNETFDFPLPFHTSEAMDKAPFKTMPFKDEITDEEKGQNDRKASASNSATASEISQMIWNISNIPENTNPKMVAWGLVDHNGGKLTIGNTGVSLTVPPETIPEGRTEGIYIAITDQKKEHPQITAKGSLLSPVVKCGPTGLKFQRPVILSMPHCALLEEGAWHLKVQYNESEPSTSTDWKQLIDVNKQDGTEESHVVVEHNMVHLMVDHFTIFAVTGESAANQQAKRTLRILAYVTPLEANSYCAVRVYCVGDTEAAVEDIHQQEVSKYGGVTIETPRQLQLKDGGGDLLVQLTDHQPGWNTSVDTKRISFRDIWEGIQRMPSCTFVFFMSDARISQFGATFEVRQDCPGGERKEVNVATSVRRRPSEKPGPSNVGNEQSNTSLTCTCGASPRLPPVAILPWPMDHSTALLNAGSIGNLWKYQQPDSPAGAYGGSPATPPVTEQQISSGYFSAGFESLPTMESSSRELRSKLALILDPPHESDWKVLAVHIGLSEKDIRWIDSRRAHSPTEILFNLMETKNLVPLRKLAEILQNMGRDDAVEIIAAQLPKKKKETVV